MKIIHTFLVLCLTMPIWLYLLYQVLVRVEASELMWFLFWIYVPFSVVVHLLAKAVEKSK